MKASADNVFVGAILTKDNEKFLAVKVNAKSMYVAKGMTLDEYNRRYSLKAKGVKVNEKKHSDPQDHWQRDSGLPG